MSHNLPPLRLLYLRIARLAVFQVKLVREGKGTSGTLDFVNKKATRDHKRAVKSIMEMIKVCMARFTGIAFV